MILGDLIRMSRRLLDDQRAPYRWDDSALTDWFNEGQLEACRRSSLIRDTQTSAICEITAGTNSFQYPIDSRIIRIERAKFSTGEVELLRRTARELWVLDRSWESATPGVPKYYTTDIDSRTVSVYPPLALAATLKLTVIREPLAPMADNDDAPEIPTRYQYGLIDWAVYRAHQALDPDGNDDNKSETALAAFEKEFGTRVSAHDEVAYERNYSGETNVYQDIVKNIKRT